MPNKNGSKWCTRETRTAKYKTANCRCVYCGNGINDGITLTLDHLIPRSAGGTNDWENLVPACMTCNRKRGDTPLQDWLSRFDDPDKIAVDVFAAAHSPRDFWYQMAKIELAKVEGTFSEKIAAIAAKGAMA